MSAADILARLFAGDTSPTILLVAAHPDDETIGAGALLSTLRNATVLHVTDGAPRDGRDAAMHGFPGIKDYAAVRRAEALAALAVAGIPPERALTLGFADQEAALHLVPLAHRITEAIARTRPDLVLTHAYEGGHPDHDAVAFATRAAIHARGVPLAEFTGYHAGPHGIEVGRFLPPAEGIVTLPLTGDGEAAKRRMLAAHATQQRVLSAFPITDESFRPAPPADFTQPPHPGALFYERFPWGMDGVRFRALAVAATAGLAR